MNLRRPDDPGEPEDQDSGHRQGRARRNLPDSRAASPRSCCSTRPSSSGRSEKGEALGVSADVKVDFAEDHEADEDAHRRRHQLDQGGALDQPEHRLLPRERRVRRTVHRCRSRTRRSGGSSSSSASARRTTVPPIKNIEKVGLPDQRQRPRAHRASQEHRHHRWRVHRRRVRSLLLEHGLEGDDTWEETASSCPDTSQRSPS